MLINILMTIFIALLVLTAWFLLTHQQRLLLAFGQKPSERKLKIIRWTAIALIIVSLLGIVILIVCPAKWNLATLILACLAILTFSRLIVSK